ncbi:hypothetical protein HYZ98_00515 [Candidatus Peregrinibacteria bacterium]|nr:hypothetical protein [Candidatus Peregrinibacteria bacterium]
MKARTHHDIILWIIGFIFFLLLLLKFTIPLLRFGSVPLGYDAGIYRYLFVHYENVFPFVPQLPDWAKEHPPGLFFLSTLLLQTGIPVEWLTGWLWNVFVVGLGCVLSWIIGKRWGAGVGVATLLCFSLSQAYYDGFVVMYWKTCVALLLMALTFHFLERRSWWAPVTIAAVLMTHHQTGLLLILVLGTWFVRWFRRELVVREVLRGIRIFKKKGYLRFEYVSLGLAVIGLALFYYIPVIQEAIFRHIPKLLEGWDAPGGSFPEPSFYIRLTGILLLFGIAGFVRSLKEERGSLWQIAVLWSAVFVVFHLMFYRRFYLQLDFFLLPFAGLFLWWAWHRFSNIHIRVLLVALVLLQGVVSFRAAWQRIPNVDAATFHVIRSLPSGLPHDATIIALEDQTAILLRGWLPFHHVGGPGLFELSWSEEEWENFLLGSPAERRPYFERLKDPTFFFISPYFRSYYGERAETFLRDPCLERTEHPYLMYSICFP